MKKAALLLVFAAMLNGSVPVLADGMFYWPETVPPEIPYQRVLLIFDGGYETMPVQSKYRMSSSATGEFGWVVPVPSVLKMASLESHLAENLFWDLALNPPPTDAGFSKPLWDLLGLICLFLVPASGFVLLLCGVSFFTPHLGFIRRRRGLIILVAVLPLLSSLAILLFVPPLGVLATFAVHEV